MPPEKSQLIFVYWLNAALKDARWRAFIRDRLLESELPVIEFVNTHDNGPRREKLATPNTNSFTES